MRDPIIFIGMHRSGTSMLGRLLEDLGLFVGAKKDENNEALFFQEINTWLLDQCGARWDNPSAIRYLWEREELLRWIEAYIRQLLDSPRAMRFLGFRRYLSTGGITRLEIPWGWKDPRNTFTLPFWLRVFPEAKILNIERQGVDVAQSLRVRSRREFSDTTETYRRYKKLAVIRPKRGGFTDSPRCASLEGGYTLWQEYVRQADDMITRIPEDRVLSLRYEEILERPVSQLRDCAVFCGLETPLTKIELLASTIDSSRAYSYQKDPELCRFHALQKELPGKCQYGSNR